jgi:hypothetical protein
MAHGCRRHWDNIEEFTANEVFTKALVFLKTLSEGQHNKVEMSVSFHDKHVRKRRPLAFDAEGADI